MKKTILAMLLAALMCMSIGFAANDNFMIVGSGDNNTYYRINMANGSVEEQKVEGPIQSTRINGSNETVSLENFHINSVYINESNDIGASFQNTTNTTFNWFLPNGSLKESCLRPGYNHDILHQVYETNKIYLYNPLTYLRKFHTDYVGGDYYAEFEIYNGPGGMGGQDMINDQSFQTIDFDEENNKWYFYGYDQEYSGDFVGRFAFDFTPEETLPSFNRAHRVDAEWYVNQSEFASKYHFNESIYDVVVSGENTSELYMVNTNRTVIVDADTGNFLRNESVGAVMVEATNDSLYYVGQFSLTKYDYNFNQQYSKNFDSLVTMLDVDSFGNAYVTSCSNAGTTEANCTLIKIGPSGNIVWNTTEFGINPLLTMDISNYDGSSLGIETLAASNVGTNDATLTANLTGYYENATVYFQFHEHGASYWNISDEVSMDSKGSVSINLTGIKSDEQYTYRAVVEEYGFNTTGEELTFMTSETEGGGNSGGGSGGIDFDSLNDNEGQQENASADKKPFAVGDAEAEKPGFLQNMPWYGWVGLIALAVIGMMYYSRGKK